MIKLRYLFLASLFLYALAAGVRLYQITYPAPQPDEVHWQQRSHELLKRIRSARYSQATTHLPHPGIPASAAMALGEHLGEYFDQEHGLQFGAEGYIDHLAGARIAVALVSSLIAPCLLLGTSSVLGFTTAFIAAGLVALDPHHIGLSRQAHLDSMLTLFSVLSVLLYAFSIRSHRTMPKLLAGIFWGLAVATKPTAGVLVAVFFLMNSLRRISIFQEGAPPKHPIISWSDVGALFLGLGIFGALYTRLWHPLHNEPYKLNFWHGRRIWIDQIGSWLQGHYSYGWFLIALSGAAALLLLVMNMRHKRRVYYHCAMLSLVLCAAGASFFIFPQLVKNMFGYWIWVAGLAKETHSAYGSTFSTSPNGYLDLFWSKLTGLAWCGLILAVPMIFGASRRRSLATEREKLFLLLSSIIATVIWTAFLSTSSKQAYRYVMPMVPLLYLVSSSGLCFAAKTLGRRLPRFTSLNISGLTVLFACSVLGWQFYATSRWHPYHHLFFNTVSGGLPGAVKRGVSLTFAGQNEAVRFLHQRYIKEKNPLMLLTIGDMETLSYAYRRLYPKATTLIPRPVSFYPWWANGQGFPIICIDSIFNKIPRAFPNATQKLAGRTPIFSYTFHGARLLSIYEPLGPTEGEPVLYDIRQMKRETGAIQTVQRLNKPFTQLVAQPKTHRPGYLVRGDFARLKPGSYEFRLGLALADFGKNTLLEEDPVVDFRFGDACHKTVLAHQLASSEDREITVKCRIDHFVQDEVVVYWPGKAPVALSKLDLHKR